MGDHEFRATLPVKDAIEAERVGREACDAYFGDRPYRMNVSTDAIVTVGGQVRGYKADVRAEAVAVEEECPRCRDVLEDGRCPGCLRVPLDGSNCHCPAA